MHWSWGWNDPNAYLRASGRDLLTHADRVGWSLYPEERAALERASELEIYLDEPLSELDIMQFGQAVEKLRYRAEGRKREPMIRDRDDDFEDGHHKQRKKKRDRDSGRDNRRH